MQINLISNTIPENNFSSNIWWENDNFEYVKNKNPYSGITIFTDESIFEVDLVTSKYKVAWLLESPAIKPDAYWRIKSDSIIASKFDRIYTFDAEIHKKYNHSVLMPYGACWISKENCNNYPKSKLLSMVASNKNYTSGHAFRHFIANNVRQKYKIDMHGSGYNPFPHTKEGRLIPFKDYKFSIVVENLQMENYFTDKIIDCFATGTIPIYWGAPNIKDFFKYPIFTFNSLAELESILNSNLDKIYDEVKPFLSISECEKYASPDNNIVTHLRRFPIV
jgi:hypothetical protein